MAAAPKLNVRYKRFERGNKSAALNAVLAAVPDGPVVFLDDDVRLEPGALLAYAAAAHARGPGSWFAGPLGVDYQKDPKRWVLPFLPSSAAGWRWGEDRGVPHKDDPTLIHRIEAMGANWCAFAEDLHRVGPFDEDRGPGTAAVGQERDMMARLTAAGVPGRYVENALVHHYVPRSRVSPGWLTNRAYKIGLAAGAEKHENVLRVPGLVDPPWLLARVALFRLRDRFRRGGTGKKAQLRVELKARRWEGVRDGLREAREAELNPAPAAAPRLKIHTPRHAVPAGPPPVYVVIPTHGRPDLIVRTLSELAKCDLPENYRGCVVAENGGENGVRDFVKTADARLKVRYLYHARGNKSSCLNAAMADIKEGLVVNFDDDIRCGKTTVVDYAAAARRHGPGQWLAGPTSCDYEEGHAPPDWVAEQLPKSAVGWNPQHLGDGDAIRAPKALGFNWAAWAEDLHAAGGYDPNYGPGSPTGATGQERDMQKKLLRAGKVGRFVASARVWHWVPAERCSVEWMYHRAYKNGLSCGRRSEQKRVLLFGRSPALELQIARAKRAAARVAKNPDQSEVARFRTRLSVQKLTGYADGLRKKAA